MPPLTRRSYRLASLDLLRGLVIVIMAIDHVRDFLLAGALQDPMTDPNVTLGLFMTRWITHFCAPVFVLLAGTSAGLMTARKSRTELARFLFTRGLWLIFVEVFVISTVGHVSPRGIPQLGGQILVTMQVIWAIGASMIVLAGAQCLGRRACLAHRALRSSPATTCSIRSGPQTELLESNVAAVGRAACADVVSSPARSISRSCIRCCRGSA